MLFYCKDPEMFCIVYYETSPDFISAWREERMTEVLILGGLFL